MPIWAGINTILRVLEKCHSKTLVCFRLHKTYFEKISAIYVCIFQNVECGVYWSIPGRAFSFRAIEISWSVDFRSYIFRASFYLLSQRTVNEASCRIVDVEL